MKYISLLFTCLFMISCGNAKEASAMSKQTQLSGNYKITSVGNKQSVSDDLIINFSIEKKMVFGFSGCNQFSGNYGLENGGLNFGPLAGTRKICQPDVNTLEQHILKALNETKRFSEENDIISFYNNEGNVIMTLGKPKMLDTEKTSELKNYNAEYTAITRGTFILISYENNSISFQKDRNNKPQVKTLSEAEIASLNAKIDELDINSLSNLEPPSKAHQYDGAAGATLKIIQNGATHQTPTFDHGNPPEVIKALVSEMILLTEKL